MSYTLFDWIGPLELSTAYYPANRKGQGERAETLFYIGRGATKAEIWIVTVEEAEALIKELQDIKKYLENQTQEVA